MNRERIDDYLDKLDNEDEEMTDTIDIRFEWKSVMPDMRKWKPSSPIFEPLAVIIIPVPATKEYFVFFTEAKEFKDELPQLTLAGMRYCIDQLETTMSDNDKSDNDDDLWDKDDNGWE